VTEYYGVRFTNGKVSPVPSLSSARGFVRVWGKAGIETALVRHSPDGWREVPVQQMTKGRAS
jgi:hypothetical protein